MKDFIRWLVDNDNPFPMVMFFFGAGFLGVLLLILLFSIGWPLGLLGVFGGFFGIPYLMYHNAKKEE